MTNQEKREKVLGHVANYLTEHVEKNIPVTIAFKPCRLRFEVYGTENDGMMQLTYNAPDQLRLQLGVYRKETDRLYSHYLPSADAEEMMRYLKDPATLQDWLEQVAHLSDSVDDFWD